MIGDHVRPGAIRRAVAYLCVAGATVLAFSGTTTAAPTQAPAPAGDETFGSAARLGLIRQTPFDLAADGELSLVLDLPTLDPALTAAARPDATVVITAYRPVNSRLAVVDARNGMLPRSGDSIDIPLAEVPSPSPEQLTVTVPTETTTRTSAALQLPQAGLHPLVIEVIDDGEVLAELLTFVHRLPTADEPPLAELPVAMAMVTTSPVVLEDDSDVVLDDETVAELEQLANLLEATDFPVAVRVPPAILLAVEKRGSEGAALAERLAAALARNELISSPRYPLDPSLAADTGQRALYTQWLRDGEDDLARAVASPARRTLAIADETLTESGAGLLRDLGARLVVITPDVFDHLPLSTGIFTDLSRLVQLEVAPGVTIDATVTERELGEVLERSTNSLALTGVMAMTHLLAYRQEIVDGGGDPRRHGITLGTSDLSLPNLATYDTIASMVLRSAGLAPTTLDVLGARTDHSILNDAEVVVGLPTDVESAAETNLEQRLETITSLSLQALSTGSMLPDGDDRVTAWRELLELLPTSAFTDDQVDVLTERMREEFDEIRSAIVVPNSFSFTLTGRSTTVPIKLQNTSDLPLKVRVRMSSLKLLFPDGDQVIELPPQSLYEVRVRIEARTNGRFPVTLQVFTPVGDSELAPAVPLSASVTALSGLGNLITGALVLVVLTWWVRHVRISRRNRAAARAAARHPGRRITTAKERAATKEAEEAAEGAAAHELSPDAATSTLPPL